MAEEPRFDWPAITRASAIIVGVTGIAGFLIPVGGTLILQYGNTGIIAGNEIFQWIYWLIAWGMLTWSGMYMLRNVGDKIIDDMLVIAIVCAIALLIVKLVIGIVYEPVDSAGRAVFPITGIDAGGALISIVVALIAARANRY